MKDDLVISVDCWFDGVPQVEVNLISLYRSNVVGVSRVRNLVVLLQGDVKSLRVLNLVLITEELSVYLDVNNRVVR